MGASVFLGPLENVWLPEARNPKSSSPGTENKDSGDVPPRITQFTSSSRLVSLSSPGNPIFGVRPEKFFVSYSSFFQNPFFNSIVVGCKPIGLVLIGSGSQPFHPYLIRVTWRTSRMFNCFRPKIPIFYPLILQNLWPSIRHLVATSFCMTEPFFVVALRGQSTLTFELKPSFRWIIDWGQGSPRVPFISDFFILSDHQTFVSIFSFPMVLIAFPATLLFLSFFFFISPSIRRSSFSPTYSKSFPPLFTIFLNRQTTSFAIVHKAKSTAREKKAKGGHRKQRGARRRTNANFFPRFFGEAFADNRQQCPETITPILELQKSSKV